jgi:hypothetical protein
LVIILTIVLLQNGGKHVKSAVGESIMCEGFTAGATKWHASAHLGADLERRSPSVGGKGGSDEVLGLRADDDRGFDPLGSAANQIRESEEPVDVV